MRLLSWEFFALLKGGRERSAEKDYPNETPMQVSVGLSQFLKVLRQ